MQVHASQLQGSVLPGVYHLFGEDGFWLDQSINFFVSMVGKDSLSLHIFDTKDSFTDAIGSLFSISFTDDISVVVVKGDLLGADVKNHKMLQDVLENDIVPNYLILVNQALDAKEKKLVNTINCTKLKEYECVKIAQDFFTFGIERDAINTLIRYTDCDLMKIKMESEKLKAYCKGRKVNIKDVENLVVEDSDVQMFYFVNSIVVGDNKSALRQLEKLKKRGESYSGMLAMLLNSFRRMLHTTISKKSDAELSQIFKVKPYAIQKARENKMFSVVKLKNAVDMIVGYELKFKSGEMSEQVAFDTAIAKLIAKEVN
jgi:DNA polymerase III delta subunit